MNDREEIVYNKEVEVVCESKVYSSTASNQKTYYFLFLNKEKEIESEEKDIAAFIWEEAFMKLKPDYQSLIEELVQNKKTARFTIKGVYQPGRAGYNTPAFHVGKIEDIEVIDEGFDDGEQVIF
ncbi:hypothetical protein GvMRE_I1g403 [endosymbiont GvMRE of Glomus versiforme]|nr:hypothetical protein GvMRE_I1g403 [endosymbiont GvMRE of Glomus versiforme]